MRLGIASNKKSVFSSPDEWAAKYSELGLGAVVFPLNHKASDAEIDSYVKACRDHDLVIAEVGAWRKPESRSPEELKYKMYWRKRQLELADYIGACCCVDITGGAGEVWTGGCRKNYDPAFQEEIINGIREIVDEVKPTRTFYTLEPMPWMIPWSPENYLDVLKRIDRPRVAVHMDAVNMVTDPEKLFFNREFLDRCFELLGPQTKGCHIKDVKLETQLTVRLIETTCGAGDLDLLHYMELAHAVSPDMPVIIEHLQTMEEYLAALRYLQDLIARSGKDLGFTHR